jgi:hypothetical protein
MFEGPLLKVKRNIRLGWKRLAGLNTNLFQTFLITAVKSYNTGSNVFQEDLILS